MSPAAKVAARKRSHPSEYCAVKGCLWRTHTAQGERISYCGKHERSGVAGAGEARSFESEQAARPLIGPSDPASASASPVPPTPAELDQWAKEYMAKKAKQAKPRCGKCGEPLNVANQEPPYPCDDCGCLTWDPKYRTDAEQARYEAKAGR